MTPEELKNSILKMKKHSEKLSEEEKELQMAMENNIKEDEKETPKQKNEKIDEQEKTNEEKFDEKLKVILDNPKIAKENKEKILKDLENIKTIENDDLISKIRIFGYNFISNEDKNNFTEVNENKEYTIEEIKDLYLKEYIKNLYEEFIEKAENEINKDIKQEEKTEEKTPELHTEENIPQNKENSQCLPKENEDNQEEIKSEEKEKKDEVKKDITNIKNELENFNFIHLDEELIEDKILVATILGILSKKNEMMENLNEINLKIQEIEETKNNINPYFLTEKAKKEIQKLNYEENVLKNKKNEKIEKIKIFNNRAEEFLIKNMRLNQTKALKEKDYDEAFKKYSLKAIKSNTVVEYSENVEKLNNLERTMGFEVLMNFADNILEDLKELNEKFEILKENFSELIEQEAMKNNKELEEKYKENFEYKEEEKINEDETIKAKMKKSM